MKTAQYKSLTFYLISSDACTHTRTKFYYTTTIHTITYYYCYCCHDNIKQNHRLPLLTLMCVLVVDKKNVEKEKKKRKSATFSLSGQMS